MDPVQVPYWLHVVAVISLAAAAGSAVVILIDIFSGHAQHMRIMNFVWPLTALWSGPVGLFSYFTIGRLSTEQRVRAARARHEKPPGMRKPFWEKAALGTTHCGSGCTLGDLVAETLVIAIPVTLFGNEVFGTWTVDFVLAFLFGIVFQYFTIAPMRGLGLKDGLAAAVKADTASLTSWQVGMYGCRIWA